MKGTLPYWESLPMSVMPIRSPPVQVVPLARVAGAMLAVNWAATGSPFRFSLSLLQAASARASVASVKNLVFIILVIIISLIPFQYLLHLSKIKASFAPAFGLLIIYKSAFTSSPFTSSQPLISAPSTSMPSGVSTSVPPRVSDSPFPVLNSLRASVRSLFSVVGGGLPSA